MPKGSFASLVKPLKGLSSRDCSLARGLVAFAAKGHRGRWWESADQFLAEAGKHKRFARIFQPKEPGGPDWAAITEMIVAIIEAISATKV